MIADSSSRLPRDTTDNNSLTTALRDRGPCLIPQPNRCLPIRPAPPTPILKARKDQLPILKLAKVSHADSVDPDTANITKSTNLKVDSLKEVETEKQLDSFKQDGSTDENRSISRDSYTLYAIKRNMSEEFDKERIKEVVKEGKKRRKSVESEVEVTAVVSREFCKNCGDNLVDKANKSNEKRVADLWNSIRSVAADVSTTENHFFKDNKVVPPLRLKKVVQVEKNDGYGNSAETFNAEEEINYRIVTHSSVHPDSISSSVFCSNCNSNSEVMEKDRNLNVTSSTSREIQSRRFLIKSDEYKLKHRRNRLKQKLKELKNKALNLAQEMSSSLSTEECNLQRNTRLRQMMNRYEKQIQNISKLLSRLSDSDSVSENLVIEIDGEEKKEEQRDDDSTCSFSSTFSSEPPKLSPRSPMDSRRSIESPDQVSSSPPILPRVSITVASDLNIQEEQNKEEIDENRKNLQLLTESTWITCNDSSVSFCANVADKSWYSSDLINSKMNEISTPSVSSSTSINPCSLDDVENTENAEVFLNNMEQNVEDSSVEIIPEGKESVEELSKHIEVVPFDDQTPLILDDMIKIQKHELNDSDINETQTQTVEDVGVKPIKENTKFSYKLQQEDIFVSSPSLTNGGSALLNTNVLHLQSNYGGATVSYRNVLDSDKMKNSRSTLTSNTVSSSNRFTDVSYMPITSAAVQERPFSVSNHQFNANKDDDLKNSCEPRNNDKHNTMADQFLTFGNWVANMAKKQTLQQKPKPQNIIPTEQTHCVIESNNQRALTNNSVFNTPRNNNVNTTSQWNCESWQHQHQQQVLQQATAFSQTSPTLTTSHSGIHHRPLSASQFYSNNYPIDPYGGAAFSYYSTLYPTYGSYPYSRLRPGSPFTGFHVPVQDPLTTPLRPLQQFNKHVTSLTDSNRHCTNDILKCSGAISNTGFQLPNTAINFDRFKVTSGSHNTETNCLSPLLLPPAPSAVVSRQQTLPRMPVNTDYGRNRTIPDVVAAAAAAAVVAAASIGHQNDSVPAYGTTGVPTDTATLEVDSTRSSDQQLHHSQLQNLLLDGVQFHPVSVDSNTAGFTQASGLASNVQTSTFKIPLIVESLPQGSKENSRNITRNCETPHLAKISRSSNSLSSLNCSNCGAAGSMFKCLGCEVAFYCDERCQARHWGIHVGKCPKRMPKLKKVV